VSGIDIKRDLRVLGELRNGVADARLVGWLSLGALYLCQYPALQTMRTATNLWDVQVCDDVPNRVGLDDEHDTDSRHGVDRRLEVVDVVLVVRQSVVRDGVLAGRSARRAVAVRKVVHNELCNLRLAGRFLKLERVLQRRCARRQPALPRWPKKGTYA
jgi:hypothetical protein